MKTTHHKRQLWAICLAALLAGIYILTYRGFPISQDEAALFSAGESFYKYQTFQLISLYHEHLFSGDPYLAASPWQDSVHEPLHTFASVPLYGLAHILGTSGMLHTVWLFNIFVMVGIGLAIYYGGISLGYSESASGITAVLMGIGTMLFPYSQTYFREPLISLLTLITFLLAFRLRQHFSPRLLVLMMVALLAAAFTKIIAFLALPALVYILLPDFRYLMSNRRLLLKLVAGTILVIVLGLIIFLILHRLYPDNVRLNPRHYIKRIRQTDLAYIRTVLGAYLVSPGRSLWATSPLLLLSFYGAWLAKDKRFAYAPFILLVTVAFGYGFGGWEWHGGRGWGTRYLLHVVPVMGLLLLPVVEQLLNKSLNRLWLIPVGLLVGFSILVQLAGVLVPLDDYYSTMTAEFPNNAIAAFYDQGTWRLPYTQWYVQLQNLDPSELDVAWSYTDAAWRGILVGVLLLVFAGMVYVVSQRAFRETPLRKWGLIGSLILLVVLGYGFALAGLDDDQRMLADRPELHELLAAAEARVGENDILFLSDPEYRNFFMNFYRGDGLLVTMPYAPGERYSFEQTPRIETDNPEERIDMSMRFPLWYAAEHYQNIWLVSNLGPFHPFAYRPVEHYLTRHFYQVESLEDIAPNARLIRFAPLPAPSYDYVYDTLYITEHEPFVFNDHITLTGYNVPETVSAGSVLPISLMWESDGQVGFDYNVGVFLVNEDGVLVASRNVQPQGTFGFTSLWQAGVPQGDNHGLAIPADLPAGTYTVQVIMYDWRDASRLPVTFEGERIPDDYAEIGMVEVASR